MGTNVDRLTDKDQLRYSREFFLKFAVQETDLSLVCFLNTRGFYTSIEWKFNKFPKFNKIFNIIQIYKTFFRSWINVLADNLNKNYKFPKFDSANKYF